MEGFDRKLEVKVKNPKCELSCSSVPHSCLTYPQLCTGSFRSKLERNSVLHGLYLEYGGGKKTVLTGMLIFTVKNTVITVVLKNIHVYD